MKVSVIIPAYGRLEPLKYTLRSASRAAYQSGGTCELLLVDDGSQPALSSQLTGFDAGHAIKHIRQENAGAIAARLNGLAHAEGEFIQLLDSDDLVHPEKFIIQSKAMEESGADVSYCDMAQATLQPGYESSFAGAEKLSLTNTPADLYLKVQPAPHNPLYRRDYLKTCLDAPLFKPRREYDPSGDVWFYYNLLLQPAKILKVDAALCAPGPHEEDRYSRHWEKLGISALLIMEAFAGQSPRNPTTEQTLQAVGATAFHSWRRLPYDFSPAYSERLLTLWKALPRSCGQELGGTFFYALSVLLGQEGAGRFLRRFRGHDYESCRTLSGVELEQALKVLSSRSDY